MLTATLSAPTNREARFPLQLGVIGAPPVWIGDAGEPLVYEPYVREMRVWADLFAGVAVVGPLAEISRRGNLAPYLRENIRSINVPYSEFITGHRGALCRLSQMPGLSSAVYRTIRQSDFVLLRSPSHAALIGTVLTRALGVPSLTKWAGENAAYPGERIPSRLNRRLQGIPSPLHCTLVYGPPKHSHEIGFLPALMDAAELDTARRASSTKSWREPWNILAVGRLEPDKAFDLAIRGLGILLRAQPSLRWTFTMVGDGALRDSLYRLGRDELGDRFIATGALSFDEVRAYYSAAHLVIMPGTQEGWPKVIAEAWAYGAVPVAARGGLVPSILEGGDAGSVFPAAPEGLARVLGELLAAPATMKSMSRRGYKKADGVSLDQFKKGLEEILTGRYGLK